MYIWDLPLRLFHWLLVISMVAIYMTGSLGGLWLTWHSHCGVLILSLIVFRIAWGFVGSRYARFASFVPTPERLRAYFSARWAGMGHSPLAAISIFALLGVILIQALSGLFTMNDEIDFYAPLYEVVSSSWSHRMTRWHNRLFDALLILISLHLLAIVYYAGVKHQNLLMPMFTGRKKELRDAPTESVLSQSKSHLFLALSLAALVLIVIESGMLLQWLKYFLKA